MKQIPIFPGKRLTALAVLTAVALTGCGSVPGQVPAEEAIVLKEPKAANKSMIAEPVERRNLYDFTLYPSTVSPYIEEYSFDTDQQFGSYGPLLGDSVRKGDVLMTASGDPLSAQIKDLQERLQDMTEDHMEYCTETEENLLHLRGELSRLQTILDNMDQLEPVPEASGEGAGDGLPEDFQQTPEYISWKEELLKWQAEYNLTDYYIATAETQLAKQTDLYNLDYGYYNGQLQELLAKRKDEVIRSQISGVVVALGNYVNGDPLPEDEPVIAVADLSRKYIRCSYIKRRPLNDAAQIYAFINGKRYEVTLDDSTDEELRTQTTFQLLDEENEVPVGSYAVLVLMSGYKEQALTVPTGAIYNEDSKDFVYILENGQTIPKEIETGMSDGLYTEVLSGLEEGEAILVSSQATAGTTTAVLQKGDTGNPYQQIANFVYPLKTVVKNPIENCDVYLEKYSVRQDGYVTAGDPLALIKVEADETELNRRELSLQRQKERLADQIAQGADENEKAIVRTRENIREEEEALAKIKNECAVTKILSPVSGSVVYLKSRSPGELISQQEPVIAYIADQNVAYLTANTANDIRASYGTVLTVIGKNYDGDDIIVECPVLTVDNSFLSSSLAGDAMVLLPPEAKSITTTNRLTGRNDIPIEVQFTGEKMENVILVPRSAVISAGSNTYVNVQNEDGSVSVVSFVCGGSYKEYYWAIDGLSEGMIICWE